MCFEESNVNRITTNEIPAASQAANQEPTRRRVLAIDTGNYPVAMRQLDDAMDHVAEMHRIALAIGRGDVQPLDDLLTTLADCRRVIGDLVDTVEQLCQGHEGILNSEGHLTLDEARQLIRAA